MLSLFIIGGPFMWLLLLFSLAIIYLIIKKGLDIFVKKDLSEEKQNEGVNGILFWGILSVVCGFLSHYSGIYLAVNAIRQAADISPQLILEGYASSLVAIIAGLWIFIISAIIWYIYKAKIHKI
ncbi:MAG TPA: hypothetical protein PLP19_21885 [bacterium]|nr:hypothetical protein [bacterium]HPN46150.1 hypothetical protein [bacterium]